MFGIPAALWLVALALLPLLALRRRPATRVPVATMHLWAAVAAREAAPLARRVRRHWVAILQAAIVAAIAIAVARPLWPSRSGVVAVVVDTSLSMSARSGGTSRLALAAVRVTEWAAGLPRGTRVRLIAASPAPQPVGEFAARGGELERALASLRTTGAGAPLDAAIAFARGASPAPARLLVVTDAVAPAGESAAEWAAVGAPADNLALVSLTARRPRPDSSDADVLAHVWNFGTRPATTTLTLTLGDGVLVREPLTIAPRAGATVTTIVRDRTGLVTGRIEADDAIGDDNARATLVAPPLAIRVAVDGDSDFLTKALRTRRGVTVVSGAAASGADVVVCAGCATVPGTAPPRAGVLITLPPAATPAASAPLEVETAGTALRSPATLDGVEAIAIDGPDPTTGTVVARAGGRPAIVAYEAQGRRVVELRLDLARSPFVLTPAFPILIADALDWLTRRDSGRAGFDGAAFSESDVSRPSAADPQDGTSRSNRGRSRDSHGAFADLSPYLLLAVLGLMALEWRLRPGGWQSGRTVAAALLAIAVLSPRIPWGDASRAIVFALDTSDSMAARRGDAIGAVARGTAGMRRGDRAGLVVFGADAVIERPLDGSPLGGTAPGARTLATATNLEQALRAARALLPADGTGRVVLVSDGRETAGDARIEALAARTAGIPVDVVMPRGTTGGRTPAAVTRLTAPPTVHQGEPFEITASVQGTPGATVAIVFDAAGAAPLRRAVALPVTGATTVSLTVRSTQPGLSVYRASLDTSDILADMTGDAAGAVVAVEGEPRLLTVSDGGAPPVAPAGYRLASMAPADLPRTTSALAAFDAVVLDDVDAARLDAAQRRALAQHVEQGGGLFVLGSARSLLPLDDADPLESALPVDLRPRRGGRAPGLALVVVFDKSGSMDDRIDGAPRIEFARQAAQRVLASLPQTDAVGVIAFDATAVEVAELRPGHDAAALTERLGRVRPSGATAVAPAIERAVSWLGAPAMSAYARRLVLLVSDGRTSPADQARARRALRPGIELSTVALGDEADHAFLSDLARAAGGRTFYPRRLGELPALAAREAVRVSGGRVVEERFTLQAGAHPLLAGLDLAGLPPLGGYVVSVPRTGADVALRSPLGDPVLATWRRGLGKVAVYTADLRSPWSAGLRSWPQGAALLAQTARWVSRRVDHPFLHVESAERDGRLSLTVEARAADGTFLSGLDAQATGRTPAGGPLEVALRPSAPGLYEGAVTLTDPGPYTFSITATSSDGRLDARVQRGVYWTAPRERGGDVDRARLAAIAQSSGGRELAPGDDPFGGPRPRDRRETRPLLAGAAMVAFLAHVLAPMRSRRSPSRASADGTLRKDAA